VLGQRRRRKLLRRPEKRAVLPAALPRQGAGPVRRRRATSRSSTTGNGCTQPSATVRPWKHSHSSRPQQPLHDQQPGKLSKIVDTARLGREDPAGQPVRHAHGTSQVQRRAIATWPPSPARPPPRSARPRPAKAPATGGWPVGAARPRPWSPSATPS
jgi:hypothetical protein